MLQDITDNTNKRYTNDQADQQTHKMDREMKSVSTKSEASTNATNQVMGLNQDSAEPQFTPEEKKSADEPNQIDELVACYLNKQFH